MSRRKPRSRFGEGQSCAHEPLGNPVGLWRAKRRTNDLNPVTAEHVVKTVGEFVVPIANQKSDRFRALRQGPRQLPSLLDDPWRVRIRCATGHTHTAAAQLDEEEDIEPSQPDRLDREDVGPRPNLCTLHHFGDADWSRGRRPGVKRSVTIMETLHGVVVPSVNGPRNCTFRPIAIRVAAARRCCSRTSARTRTSSRCQRWCSTC